MSISFFRWSAQAVLYAAFAGVIALCSQWPPYQPLQPDQALLKISFLHHGQRLAACVEQSPEELAKLPPNMRAPMRCPRERAPVTIEVDLDGRMVYSGTAPPVGLSRDGPASVYRSIPVPAGTHRMQVRFRDSARPTGFDVVRDEIVQFAPLQVRVVDFSAERGGITIE
ncbi:MAG: hypothetical protein IPF83_10035 [Rhodanobacteraceae bacterium]|nr:hypothetical protein [Rhodanobacteraceae bacterium]MBP9153892.1 hypothetical protein [Xanthomonadales bacterium]HQW82747.1 hypothetical protein [Pseudomonadota bacterium]